jgi:glycosyltransferase involved in cell wall biosynthesis
MAAAPTHQHPSSGPASSPAPPAPIPAQSSTPRRPRVALVHLVATPYWLHLHRRIDRELPEVELHCLYTHDVPNQPWDLDAASDVRPVPFGKGEAADGRNMLATARRELRRSHAITRWLEAHDVRLVVLYGYNDAGRLRILRWCRRRNLPCLLTSDSNAKLDRATGLKKLAKKLLVGSAVRAAWGAMPFGSAGTRYYQSYGTPSNRIYRFPGEPDYTITERTTPADVAAIRQRFSLDPARRRIVFCGRLVDVKRVDTLIDALNAVADQRPDWDLVIVGDGPLKEGLVARIRPDLAPRVKWLGFIGDAPTLAAVYKACDLLVLPSQFDQWALVVNEAVAAGLAVITSEVVGAADDLLRPGVNGYTFPPGDSAALAKAMLDTTAPANIDRFKAASLDVIADWRRESDPVEGLRRALRDAGVI